MTEQFGTTWSFTKEKLHAPYPFISPTRPELSCAEKNVIVTGGGTGIGFAIAKSFAEAGAKSVTIVGRREEVLKDAVKAISETSGNQASKLLYQVADVTSKAHIDIAFERLVQQVGKIDILVSNAYGPLVAGPVESLNAEDLRKEFEITVVGAFNVIQAFLAHAGPDPVLLNTSTCMVHWAPVPQFSIYTVTKTAALRLFDTLAAENPSLHIVNVQPGWVATPGNGHQKEAQDDRKWLRAWCYYIICLTKISNDIFSCAPRQFLRLARFLRGEVPQRQTRLGQLGCRGVAIKSR